MTSELKPCLFCGGKSAVEQIGTARMSTIYQCEDCGCRLETSETFNHGNHWNTRAAPDAPELERYDKSDICLAIENGHDPLPSDDGEYARYNQAAAIIADKDEMIMRMDRFAQKYKRHMHNSDQRAKTAEAELAQIKAQEPVAWRCKQYVSNAAAWEYQDAPFNDRDPEFNEQHPLYAAPVDQTAEIERLRSLLERLIKWDKDFPPNHWNGKVGLKELDRIIADASAALSEKSPS